MNELNISKPKTGATDSGLPSQYLDADQLLEALFAPSCRPSLRWLRSQQATGQIPFVRIGRLVFFDPLAVKAHLDNRATSRRSMAHILN